MITGASRGIGAALAREFSRRGSKVSVVARSKEPLEAVAQAVNGTAFVADLTDPVVTDGLIARVEGEVGPVDILVNNAGVETSAWFHNVDAAAIRNVVRLNLEAPLVLSRAALDGMVVRNRGHLFFTSSVAATGGFPGLASYCATKAGITNFAAALTMELKDTNIKTTVMAPGPVDTPMWDKLEEAVDLQPMVKRLNRLQLIPKVSPERIAQLSVDAVEADTLYVGLPRRLGANHLLRNLPSLITRAALKGVPLGPQLKR